VNFSDCDLPHFSAVVCYDCDYRVRLVVETCDYREDYPNANFAQLMREMFVHHLYYSNEGELNEMFENLTNELNHRDADVTFHRDADVTCDYHEIG
jgi:hypothetical protein